MLFRNVFMWNWRLLSQYHVPPINMDSALTFYYYILSILLVYLIWINWLSVPMICMASTALKPLYQGSVTTCVDTFISMSPNYTVYGKSSMSPMYYYIGTPHKVVFIYWNQFHNTIFYINRLMCMSFPIDCIIIYMSRDMPCYT